MSATRLAHICRHPVKSVGYEELGRVALEPFSLLPFDRVWAVAHGRAKFEGDPESWVPKANFLVGFAEAALMAIRAEFDEARQRLTLSAPGRDPITLQLPEEGPELVEWLRPLWPAAKGEVSRLVARQDGGALTDIRETRVSLLSLASLAELEEQIGAPLSIHRFRGNLWLEGLAPWAEFDLIGQEISIGAVRLRIEERIGRCKATSANPETGVFDADTLKALRAGWGHQDFGVYATVLNGGEIALGDEVTL